MSAVVDLALALALTVALLLAAAVLLLIIGGGRQPSPEPPVVAGDARVPGGNRRFEAQSRRVLPFPSTPNTPAEQRKSS